jgi:hypothetical protein
VRDPRDVLVDVGDPHKVKIENVLLIKAGGKQERGQAHLPDPELTKRVGISPRMAFKLKAIGQVPESQGREGRLAPAATRRSNTFCAKLS